MNRVETTSFMLMSVDGKISTGDNDSMDVDKDFPKIPGAAEGLHQYYDLEGQTDLFSLNTGRVMAKIGINTKTDTPEKTDVSFILIDNEPHLTEQGIRYLSAWLKKLYVVTVNHPHPTIILNLANVEVIPYNGQIDFPDLFARLKTKYGVEKLTIQSGGTMNSIFIRQGLIDHLSIVVAPVIIGGKNTATLVDGESLHSVDELAKIKPLRLVEAKQLDNSYLHLKYDVIN